MDRTANRWVFRFGDALPADDERARFLVSVGAALNDLLFLNRLYVPDPQWGLLRREGTPGENPYLIRLVASTVFELCRLLDKGKNHRPVKDLLDHLGSDGISDLHHFMTLAHLRPRLEHIRNLTSHYPWPDEPVLVDAMREVVDIESGFEADDDSMASIRASFADDVLIQTLGDNEDEIRRLVIGLADLVTTAIRLCQHIIIAYVESLSNSVVTYLPQDGEE